MTACDFFRVYVPQRVDPIIQDLYDAQAGKYLVTLPAFADEDHLGDGTKTCKAVIDDFGNLRRVS